MRSAFASLYYEDWKILLSSLIKWNFYMKRVFFIKVKNNYHLICGLYLHKHKKFSFPFLPSKNKCLSSWQKLLSVFSSSSKVKSIYHIAPTLNLQSNLVFSLLQKARNNYHLDSNRKQYTFFSFLFFLFFLFFHFPYYLWTIFHDTYLLLCSVEKN